MGKDAHVPKRRAGRANMAQGRPLGAWRQGQRCGGECPTRHRQGAGFFPWGVLGIIGILGLLDVMGQQGR